jgi:hypothetical protein
LQDYLDDPDGYKQECAEDDFKCKKKRDERYKSVLELVKKDDNLLKLGFSSEEMEIVERLTQLSAGSSEYEEIKKKKVDRFSDEDLLKKLTSYQVLEDGFEINRKNREQIRELVAQHMAADVGAERMADVEFSFLPFMEDMVHKEAEWWKIGPRGVSRRIGGDADFAAKTDAIMTKIDNGLFGPEDRVVVHRKELAKSMFELYGSAQHMDDKGRRNLIAAKADTIIENLYKADWWANWLPGGWFLDWGGPFNLWKPKTLSSNAQRKFGNQALSMTKLEIYSFVNDLRPMIGNELAEKLMKKHRARVRNVIASLAVEYGPFALGVGLWALIIKPFLDELAGQLKEVAG